MFQLRYSSVMLSFHFTYLPSTVMPKKKRNLTLISFKDEIHFFSSKSCCNQQYIFTIYLLLPEKQHRICALNGTRNCFRCSSTTYDKSEGLNWDQVLYETSVKHYPKLKCLQLPIYSLSHEEQMPEGESMHFNRFDFIEYYYAFSFII